MLNNNVLSISDASFQSIALKFQSVDLALRGLKQMTDEVGHVDQIDIDAVKKIYGELHSEFLDLRIEKSVFAKVESHD